MCGSASCRLHAERVVAEGAIPATQTLAATFWALAAEAAIMAVHEEFPLGGRMLALDIRRGVARTLKLSLDPACLGVHPCWGSITPLPVRSTEPLSAIFEAVRGEFSDPVLYLSEAFIRSAPCHARDALLPGVLVHLVRLGVLVAQGRGGKRSPRIA